jgi:hypothetical protein
MQKVRTRSGTPTAADFSSADGSPLVQDRDSGQWWALGTNDTPYPLTTVNVRSFGAKADGTDDSAAFAAAIAASRYVYVPAGTYTLATGLTFGNANQVLFGDGAASVLSYTGTGTAINGNGKYYIAVENLKITTSTGAIGIDLPFITHFWRVIRCHISGFSTAGVRGTSCFHGLLQHCDIETNAIGFKAVAEVNGCHLINNSFRQNLIGVSIEGNPISSQGNIVMSNVIESARALSTYAVQILGGVSNVINCNRLEYTTGTAHVYINSDGVAGQYNQITGNVMEGTIAAMILGDGVGSNQVLSTYVSGGRAIGAITINSDCTYTDIRGAPTAFAGAITDSGYGSKIEVADSTAGKRYVRAASENTAAKSMETIIGGTAVITDYNSLVKRLDFTELSDAFQFYAINPAGTAFAVMRFGAYRLWISPSNGKLYTKGSEPTTDTDGTVVGTQS